MRRSSSATRLTQGSCWAFVTVTCGAYAVAAAPPGTQGSGYLALHAVLTILMLLAWTGSRHDAAAAVRITLAAGIVARLSLLAVPAFTTHDVDRYLWDGAVALAGFDPYVLAPQAAQLAELRLHWPTPAEHAAYPTLYPPIALSLFALCAQAGPEWAPWIWKLAVVGASIATLQVALLLLQRHRLERHLPLIALSPLLVLETGVGAHVDAFSTLCIALAVLWASDRRALLCGVAIGLGAAIKLLPIVVLLPLAVALGLRGALRLLGGALLVLAASYGLALAAGWQAIGSLPLFVERWRFGAPLHAGLTALMPAAAATVTLLSATVLLLGCAAWRARRDSVDGMQLSLAAPLLCGPVVFPWYLAALLPGLALRPNAWVLAWVSTLPLTYEVLNQFNATGVWAPAQWPLWTVACAVAAGVTYDVVTRPRPGPYSFRLQS